MACWLQVRYFAQLIGIPLVAGFVVSRVLADPILNFSLRNNPDAFELTDTQKVEGAQVGLPDADQRSGWAGKGS